MVGGDAEVSVGGDVEVEPVSAGAEPADRERADKLVGALQTRYGWSREEAENEIERRMGRAA